MFHKEKLYRNQESNEALLGHHSNERQRLDQSSSPSKKGVILVACQSALIVVLLAALVLQNIVLERTRTSNLCHRGFPTDYGTALRQNKRFQRNASIAES